MVEKKSSEVHMHEIDPSALELLVEYTYTSQIIISENNVQVYWFYFLNNSVILLLLKSK